MNHYLVMYKGEWHIATPSATQLMRVSCEACQGKGFEKTIPGECESCHGKGHFDDDQIRLCWVDKSDTSLICLGGEEERIERLPED